MAEQQDVTLPFSHKYIKNTSTCGTILTEYLLNTARTPQTAERARKSPCNQVGKKKKKKARKESRQDLCPWEGAVKEERCQPPWQGDWPGQKGSFRDLKESAAASLRQPE